MPVNPKKVKRPWKPERKAFAGTINNKKYNTYKWRMFSLRFREANPLCVKCEEEGITSAARVVDHKVRIEDGGTMYDEDNCQSLCIYHHNSKSGKESHGYKEK